MKVGGLKRATFFFASGVDVRSSAVVDTRIRRNRGKEPAGRFGSLSRTAFQKSPEGGDPGVERSPAD